MLTTLTSMASCKKCAFDNVCVAFKVQETIFAAAGVIGRVHECLLSIYNEIVRISHPTLLLIELRNRTKR